MKRFLFALAAILIVAPPANAHVGNKDVYQTVTAGPYKLFITIRTPLVIPGVATIEVRSTGASLSGLTITPLMLTGDASRHPPTPDAMQQSKDDPSFYTGSLWLMSQGSWQVRFGLTGAAGPMAASVPVPAMATAALTMDRSMAMLLGILGLILTVGVVGIVMAAIGESRLTPGVRPDAKRKRTASPSWPSISAANGGTSRRPPSSAACTATP
jgi:CubicO group peptidase (beta-lactamase class C family)